jgi:DNA polymerase-3 subunit alpha
VQAAVDNKMPAIALTDHGNMFGIMEFYLEAKSKGIKPILGVEAYMANGSMHDKTALKEKRKNYFHVVLLAKNNQGYKNLCKMVSIAYLDGFYQKPRIDREVLKEYSEGIICTSACLGGVVGSHLVQEDLEAARESAIFYKELFGEDFYLELQNHGLKDDKYVLEYVPKLAKELDIKLICSNDIHYDTKDNAVAHNIMLMIQNVNAQNAGNIDIERLRYEVPEFYFKSEEQMRELFSDYPEALDNTIEIADKCNVELDLKTNHMPSFPIPESSNASDLDEYLKEISEEGLKMRFGEDITEAHRDRLDYELSVIKNMGFPGYFLIVADFIKKAKQMGISVGPGRGSAAGSLVAYCTEITNVDPLKYDLLFERFLNPSRVTMPDVDIDFDDTRREEVIAYVRDKYGEKACAMIVTYNKMTSKAVLKDVGRVLNIPLAVINQLTPLIPVVFGKVEKLEKAIELENFKKQIDKIKRHPHYGQCDLDSLFKYSLQLEDKVRGTGIHAAGVVIGPEDLTNFCPIFRPSSSKADQAITTATQYSMNYLELSGLLKMDFLGLKTLSIIKDILDQVKTNHNEEIVLDNIDMEDKKALDVFGEGKTLSVFQFESAGMRQHLKHLKPANIEEIAAMNALFRPGPMEHIPEFIDRKFGRKPIELIHEKMEPSLSYTYGIIVYQEQVMRLTQDVAGYTLAEADLLRRAMGKKDLDKMEKQHPSFIAGSVKNGLTEKQANGIWDLIFSFANYGFNKSHAVAYSLVAYQTGWLKAHYPSEFYAANMTAELNDHLKLVALKEEAEEFGVRLLPPDVNNSKLKFVADGEVIYFGMNAIKNVGSSVVENIVEARKEEPFKDFYDFLRKIDPQIVNKRALEALISAGAFDNIMGKECRSALMLAIEQGMEFSKAYHSTKDEVSLFGGGSGADIAIPKMPEADVWDDRTRLLKEKEVLGYFVTGHLLNKYEQLITSLNTSIIKDDRRQIINAKSDPTDYSWNVDDVKGNSKYQKKNNKNKIIICGMVHSKEVRMSRNKREFAFLNIEDYKGIFEAVAWSDAYEFSKECLKDNSIICIIGTVDTESEELKIIIDRAYPIDQIAWELAKGYNIWLDSDNLDHIISMLNSLKEFTEKSISLSSLPTNLHITYNNGSKCEYAYKFDTKISKNRKTMNSLRQIFGSRSVFLDVKKDNDTLNNLITDDSIRVAEPTEYEINELSSDLIVSEDTIIYQQNEKLF